MLHFLGPAVNPAEPSITTLDGAAQWVWHMGLYAGSGRFLVGDHFAGAAVDQEIVAYLQAHADVYIGVLVARIADRPKPKRCRVVATQRAPAGAATHP